MDSKHAEAVRSATEGVAKKWNLPLVDVYKEFAKHYDASLNGKK